MPDATKPQKTAAPRATRISAATVRERMLTTARDVVLKDGLTVGFDHIPMEECIKAAGVPRSSVYRIWSTRQEFVSDLVAEVFSAERYANGFDPLTTELARTVLAENQHRMADKAGRRAVFHEMVRIGCETNFRHITRSSDWQAYSTLRTAVGSMADGPARVAVEAMVREVEERFNARMTEFYAGMIELFEMRLRPGAGPEQMAVMGSVIVDGLAHRQQIQPDLAADVIRAPGLDGELVDWHVAAFALKAFIDDLVLDLGPHEG